MNLGVSIQAYGLKIPESLEEMKFYIGKIYLEAGISSADYYAEVEIRPETKDIAARIIPKILQINILGDVNELELLGSKIKVVVSKSPSEISLIRQKFLESLDRMGLGRPVSLLKREDE